MMVYASYSVGYRPGGINRTNKNTDWTRTLWGQQWSPDELTNYEVGLRSRWADDSLQLNVTGFYMAWDDYIHQAVDPSSGTCVIPSDPWPACPGGELPWVSLVGNVGDAHIQGVQAEVDWVPAEGWVVAGNAQWIEAELDTTDERSGLEKGMRTPNNAKFQGALWATYSWPTQLIAGGELFVRGQMSYAGEMVNKLQPCSEEACSYPQFESEPYTVADLRIGLRSPNGWQLDLYANNVTLYVNPHNTSDQFWNYNSISSDSTLSLKVSLFVYVVGLLAAIGWIFFFVFGVRMEFRKNILVGSLKFPILKPIPFAAQPK